MTDVEYSYHHGSNNFSKGPRMMNKGSELTRGGSSTNYKETRRKTAAERLEADKLKYVKSDKARQQKITESQASSPHNDSTGAHSTASTGGSPTHMDDVIITASHHHNVVVDDVIDDLTSGALSQATKSKTDAADLGRSRKAFDRFRNKSAEQSANNRSAVSRLHDDRPHAEKKPLTRGHSLRDKSSSAGKISNYLNRAKEGLKAVVSGNGADDAGVGKGRQSRAPAPARSTKARSASVGANTARAVEPPSPSSHKLTMSPRSQLKQVRDNLKKVNRDYRYGVRNNSCADENGANSQDRSTFTAPTSKQQQGRTSECESTAEQPKRSPSWTRSRPLSMIENKSNLMKPVTTEISKQGGEAQKNGVRDVTAAGSTMRESPRHQRPTPSSSSPADAAHKLKRKSWCDATEKVAATKLSEEVGWTTNVPRQRKSWSKPPPSTSLRSSANRASLHESGNRGKTITEVLEEIINPCSDTDMDTAYNSMSPDASVDCKTLVGSPPQPPSPTLMLPPQPDILPSEKWDDSPPQPASERPPPSSEHRRVDQAPTSRHSPAVPPSASPMLAPRSRREVAPPPSSSHIVDSRRGKEAEGLNTMRSHNTTNSSSSVTDNLNKPLIALTASDLKPRRVKRASVPTVPVRPTYPYPVQAVATANARASPKRHSVTSPPLSPHKQSSRGAGASSPYSSLQRTSNSSSRTTNSSLKRRQRSKSDVVQTEVDRFFSTMGMDQQLPLTLNHHQVSSESDFSFAGASAYVRENSVDENMDVDPMTHGLAQLPTVSIIEKNARVMRWLMSCKKLGLAAAPSPSGPHPMPPPRVPLRRTATADTFYAPPPQHRVSAPKESDV